MAKKSLFVEFTTTNVCNCNCKYCFEKQNISCFDSRNIEEEQRQIKLLEDTCKQFDCNKYDWLTISFWGGEPLLNYDFMLKLIAATCNYSFVRYHIYSNGTLTSIYQKLSNEQFFDRIKNRMNVQLSYDGEPHHTLMRGDNSASIFKTADLLKQTNVQFSFKATLSFDLLDKLPEIWQSYAMLHDKYGSIVRYSPTLDTTYKSDDKLHIWTNSLLKIIKLERNFILKHGYPLWDWFGLRARKANCALGNSIHMQTDGTIYICHGCAYTNNNNLLKLGSTKDIKTFFDIFSDKYQFSEIPLECKKCPATHCQVCHIEQIDKSKNPQQQWISCRLANLQRCKYYKVFGFLSKLLKQSFM